MCIKIPAVWKKKSFIGQLFPRLVTPKDAFTSMHEGSSLWKDCASERVNDSLELLKSAEKYLYPTFSSFWAIKTSWLLVNTLTAN